MAEPSSYQEVKVLIRSLIISAGGDIFVDQLKADFAKMVGSPIPYGRLGFSTLELFLASMPDALTLVGSGFAAKVHFVSNNKTDHIFKLVRQQKKPSVKNSKNRKGTVCFNTNKSQATGISNTHSNERTQTSKNHRNKCEPVPMYTYQPQSTKVSYIDEPTILRPHKRLAQKTEVLQQNELQNIACKSSENRSASIVIDRVPKSKNAKRPQAIERMPEEQYISSLKALHINDGLLEYENKFNDAVPKYAVNNLVFEVGIPEKAVGIATKIRPYELSDNITCGTIVQIFVTEVHSPSMFWFNISKDEYSILDELMISLEHFYSPLGTDYFQIEPMSIVPGVFCVVQYLDMWHRAKITSVINDSVKVFFVDYATVTSINIKNIKYLAAPFADIPAQAIRGSLSHIKPNGDKWSLEAKNKFVDMAKNMNLTVQITEIDKKNRAISMKVCDLSGKDVIQINENLVKMGLALSDEDWYKFKNSEVCV